jgi:hypothetical protein
MSDNYKEALLAAMRDAEALLAETRKLEAIAKPMAFKPAPELKRAHAPAVNVIQSALKITYGNIVFQKQLLKQKIEDFQHLLVKLVDK